MVNVEYKRAERERNEAMDDEKRHECFIDEGRM